MSYFQGLQSRLAGIAFLAACLVVLPATAFAQSGGGNNDERGGHFANPQHLMRMADELDLDDDQRSQIQTILQESRDEIRPLRQQMRDEGKTLREMLDDGAADRRALLDQLDVALEAEAEFKRQRMEIMLDVREVLDDDQREQAREIFGERREQMRERIRERGGDRRQQRQQRRQRRGE